MSKIDKLQASPPTPPPPYSDTGLFLESQPDQSNNSQFRPAQSEFSYSHPIQSAIPSGIQSFPTLAAVHQTRSPYPGASSPTNPNQNTYQSSGYSQLGTVYQETNYMQPPYQSQGFQQSYQPPPQPQQFQSSYQQPHMNPVAQPQQYQPTYQPHQMNPPVHQHVPPGNQYIPPIPHQYNRLPMGQPQYSAVQGVPNINASQPILCSGKKKALLIGINYKGQRGQLSGCVNDVKNLSKFLIERHGFSVGSDSMVILTDEAKDPNFIPTRRNIINAMQWLVAGVRPGDSLFFHFSGHGSQVKDRDGDEDDGYDETILPIDHSQAGQITDDEMNAIMVRPLPANVQMLAIYDSCHSGTALDLPYQYLPDGRLKEKNLVNHASSTLQSAATSFLKGGSIGAGMSLFKGLSNIGNIDKSKKITQRDRTTFANVVSLSGCKDKQTSADTHVQGYGATGAMSYAFMKAMSGSPRLTYGQLLGAIRDILRREYSQIPQLSSGRPMDMNQYFLL